MKLKFKLWGIHPFWNRNENNKVPWVIGNLSLFKNRSDNLNNHCISFMTRSTTKRDVYEKDCWVDYKLKKL